MIVVSDTSPLIMLARIDALALLPALFGSVIVPGEVADELRDEGRGRPGSDLTATQAWLQVRAAPYLLGVEGLGPGEAAAIPLAKESGSDLLIDDQRGRRAATAEGVRAIGTVGVLEAAADRGLIDLEAGFLALKAEGFWITDRFMQSRLEAFRLRKSTAGS